MSRKATIDLLPVLTTEATPVLWPLAMLWFIALYERRLLPGRRMGFVDHADGSRVRLEIEAGIVTRAVPARSGT
ncbi:MAG TPA: hypothetical protein VFD49_08980 [Candidatus Dormibacteraeota bacterium]|nr:hypothetical protein [Candidatus Dormibacteraeota bacterium]